MGVCFDGAHTSHAFGSQASDWEKLVMNATKLAASYCSACAQTEAVVQTTQA
jgi:hypothetical protein